MTQEEYAAILKERYAKVDWSDRGSIKLYNEFARELRKLYLEQQERRWKG